MIRNFVETSEVFFFTDQFAGGYK